MNNLEISSLFSSCLLHSESLSLVVLSLEGKVIFHNVFFGRLFSNQSNHLIGTSFENLLSDDEIQHFREIIRTYREDTTQIKQFKSHTLEPTKRTIVWEISTLPIPAKQEWYITFLGYCETNSEVSKDKFQELERKYHQLVSVAKNIPNTIITTNKNKEITWVNENFQRITGYSPKEAIGKNLFFLVIDDFDAKTLYTAEEALNQNESINIELSKKSKNGLIYWVSVEIQPLKDINGDFIGFVAIESDITHRKEMEELLIMSEKRLIANLDNTPNVAIQWYDEEGKITYWNKASENLYGWTAEEAIGKTLDQLIHTPEEMAEFMRILENIKKTGEAYGPYETSTLHRDGTQNWVLATTFGIPVGNQKMGFVCMDVDITQQKNISNALIESEERYRSVVSAVGEGIVVQDLADKIVMCNQSAADILGLTIDQLKGKDSYDPNWQALKEDGTPFKPEEHPTMITLRTGQPVSNVLMNVNTGKGERKYIIINSRPVLNHKGEMYGAVASFNDITRQKIAEQELKKINQELLESQHQLQQNILALYASQAKIEEQKQQLEEEVKERIQAEAKILAQNEILREIAWHQSHSIRRPVATTLGLINLITSELASENEKMEYFNLLHLTVHELDKVIHSIVQKINETDDSFLFDL